jgi:hypothetical protein
MGQNISEWNCLIENLQAVRDLDLHLNQGMEEQCELPVIR